MRRLTLEELDERSEAVDAAADVTPGIDRWCASLDWQLPVTTGFAPRTRRLLLADPDHQGFLLLNRYRDVDRAIFLGGLEPLWGFASPLLGPDPARVAARAIETLAAEPDWQFLALPGLPPIPRVQVGDGAAPPTPADQVTMEVAMALSRLGRVGFTEGITRQVADLSGGFDSWFGRRSAKFRRNLRRAEAAATQAGVVIVDATPGHTTPDPEALFERLLAIEHRSWKGHEGSGITGAEMTTTYRTMVARLARRHRLLVNIATLDGDDVGYILGGLRQRRYRGLQISFTTDVAPLSIGNVLQAHQLRQLTDNDLADSYDMGMDFDYKRRWADRPRTSITLVLQR